MNTIFFNCFTNNNFDLKFPYVSEDFSFSVTQFSEILSILSNELHLFYNFQTIISPIYDESMKSSLYMEITALLQEMDSPYSNLFESFVENKILTKDLQLVLIRYLYTEIAAAQIIVVENRNCSFSSKSFDTNFSEIIEPALDAVDLDHSELGVTCKSIFSKIESRVCEKLSSVPSYFIGYSLLPSSLILTDHQWSSVEILISALNKDYSTRRETYLKRLSVSLQSYLLSPKANAVRDSVWERFDLIKSKWDSNANINLVDLLAARSNPYMIIYKTSSGASRDVCISKLNKHLIGPVPDRGGRAADLDATEMPDFKKRKLQ